MRTCVVTAAFFGTVLLAAPAAAATPGEGPGKVCLSVPVDSLAQTVGALFGSPATRGQAATGGQAAPASPAAAGAGTTATAAAATSAQGSAQALPGVPLVSQLLGAGLPSDLRVLEAVPC